MKKLISFLAMIALAIPSFAQEAEMADKLRSEGKIYVLVAIILVILGGLVAYLVMIERKVSRLEKKLDDDKAL